MLNIQILFLHGYYIFHVVADYFLLCLCPSPIDFFLDSSLCAEDKEALESWIMRMRESDAYDMVEEGWRELRGMGMDLEDENKFY